MTHPSGPSVGSALGECLKGTAVEWEEWAIEGGNAAQLVAQAHKEFQQVLHKTEK